MINIRILYFIIQAISDSKFSFLFQLPFHLTLQIPFYQPAIFVYCDLLGKSFAKNHFLGMDK